MENAAEALKMAFGVMMFVLALSLSISCFSQASSAIDNIITSRDRESDYMYVTPSRENKTVGVETIIPTIYKAYKENFAIVFKDQDGNPLPLYYYTDSYNERVLYNEGNSNIVELADRYDLVVASDNYLAINYIDLEKEVISTPAEAVNHINILLNKRESANNVENRYHEQFMYTQGLYDFFKDKKFEEQIGEYYQEDLGTGGTSEDSIEANKTKKRVITYTLKDE